MLRVRVCALLRAETKGQAEICGRVHQLQDRKQLGQEGQRSWRHEMGMVPRMKTSKLVKQTGAYLFHMLSRA